MLVLNKKICLVLLAISLATPISYASYVTFFPPQVIKHQIQKSQANRAAYKPYSGGRSDALIRAYDRKNDSYIRSVGNDFKNSDRRFNDEIKQNDAAMKAFDRM